MTRICRENRLDRPLSWARSDRGAALVVALLATMLMTALALGLTLVATTEIAISGHHRDALAARYAAEAAIARALVDLRAMPDWNPAIQGLTTASFDDRDASDTRTLADGATMSVAAATNLANCGHAAACTPAELDQSTADRPWGANNPRWMLFARAPLAALVASSASPSIFVVVWIADDPSETDSDPLHDGAPDENPGSGLVQIRAEAFGPGGVDRVAIVTIQRAAAGVRVLSWRE